MLKYYKFFNHMLLDIPWYVKIKTIYTYFQILTVIEEIKWISIQYLSKLEGHPNYSCQPLRHSWRNNWTKKTHKWILYIQRGLRIFLHVRILFLKLIWDLCSNIQNNLFVFRFSYFLFVKMYFVQVSLLPKCMLKYFMLSALHTVLQIVFIVFNSV